VEPEPQEPPAPPEPATIPRPEPPLEPAAGDPDGPALSSPAELDTVLAAVLDDLGSAHHRPFSRG
jgi:hypothetical protein